MLKHFELLIATRFMRSKRKDSFISVVTLFSLIGIALGVATLIIVMSVMNGYHIEFVKNILGIQGHITVASLDGEFKNYTEFTDRLEKIKNVEFAAPIIVEQAMFIINDKSSGGIVRGIEPEKLGLKPLIKDALSFQSLQRFKNHEGVLLGQNLAQLLNISIDDNIKVVIPQMSTTILGNVPRSKTFKVVGFFDVGLYQYNSTTIFMDLADAQKLYKFSNSVSEIEIMVENTFAVKDVKEKIRALGDRGIKIIDWEMAQAKWLSALQVERNVMFLILTLIILVAVFNIISSLIMLVKDKSKSIAILRTMGAGKASIIKIFVICGSLIGFIGASGGVILGILVSKNIETIKIALESLTGLNLFDPMIYFLTHLPSELQFKDVALVFCLSFGFSIIATIYPAYRASKLSPTEVLRYE